MANEKDEKDKKDETPKPAQRNYEAEIDGLKKLVADLMKIKESGEQERAVINAKIESLVMDITSLKAQKETPPNEPKKKAWYDFDF